MNPEVQMVNVQDTFVPENMEVSSGEAAGGANPLMKVHQYLRGRYLKAIVTGVILAAAGATVGYFAVPLKYTSVGQIQVKSSVVGPLSTGQENNAISGYAGFVQTQMILLQRPEVIARAITSAAWRAVSPLGTMTQQEEIAEFMDSLTVYHPPETELILVQFRDEDPTKAKVGADSVINAYKDLSESLAPDNWTERMNALNQEQRKYLNLISGLRMRIQDVAPDYFGDDLGQVHAQTVSRIQEVEAAIGQLKVMITGMPAATMPSADGVAATQPEKVEITPELAERYDSEIRDLRMRMDRLRMEIENLTKSGLGVMSSAIRSRTIEYSTLEQERQQRIAALRERIEKEPQTIANTPAGSPLPTRQQAETRLRELETVRTGLQAESNKQVQMLRDIERWSAEISAHQKWLEAFESRITSEMLNRPFNTLDRRILPYAASTPHRPDKDRRIVGAAGGGVGGLVLGVGLFIAIGFFDRRLRSVADARDSLDRSNRILGILPSLPEDLSDPDQSSTAAFCVHHIRTLLQVGGSGTQNSVIAITSASPGDGKTSLVISLGLSYAATGAKTLLIDTDLIGAGLTSRANAIARRKIGSILLREKRISQEQLDEALDLAHRRGKRLGEILLELGYLKQGELDKALVMQQETSLGLLDVLDGEPLTDCVFPGWANNLSILPVGNVGASHAGQISLRAVRRIIAEARTQYDVVLVDTGPILGSLEACLVAAAVDEVIVAVARDQQRPLVEKTFARLREVGARIAGIVFNRAPREDVESGGYTSSVTSQRLQSPMIRGNSEETKTNRLQRLGPVVRAVAGEGPEGTGDGL